MIIFLFIGFVIASSIPQTNNAAVDVGTTICETEKQIDIVDQKIAPVDVIQDETIPTVHV